MAPSARFLRIPRPRSFLYFMSLRTGTELITLSLLLNKVSGLYGLLALFTGFHLSPFQLSMYIYSVLALILTAWLAPHIRPQSPFHCLALAWFYVLDSVVNALYTTAFAVTWFLVLSLHHSDAAGSGSTKAPGGSTIDDTAGFTSPKFDNVSHVDVTDGKGDGPLAVAQPGRTSTATGPSLGHGVFQPESGSSITVICLLWALRFYFVLVVMSYARTAVRQHVAIRSRAAMNLHTGSKSSDYIEDPFAPHLKEGSGLRGRIGRLMTKIGRSYWLGAAEDGDEHTWMETGLRTGRNDVEGPPGNGERERRRRSGTGPPLPMPNVSGAQGQFLRVQEPNGGK